MTNTTEQLQFMKGLIEEYSAVNFNNIPRHTDQTNLPELIVPECLNGAITNVSQIRNVHGAVIRNWNIIKDLNEEQYLALFSLMFA